MIELIRYLDDADYCPLTEWLRSMKDKRARAQIEIRLQRLSAGNFGQCRTVRSGVMELKIDMGPGYRVYCARHGETLVILLCAGDKSSQDKDIDQAVAYWKHWKERNQNT
jgi:putative addiction module killer protein